VDLTNEFRVPLAVDDAWAVLTDVERIAPCMPGTTLESVEGDDYKGTVKVKVGPMTAQYRGTARFLERDDAGRRAVLKAEGRDTRGQGNASATITATITPDGDGSAVTVVTDLTITGKVAQFGRGVLADVSTKLMGQFVDCLEKDLAAQASTATSPNGSSAAEVTPMPPRPAPAAEPVNLVTTAGAPVAKRTAPLVAVVFLAYWLLRRRRRRKRAAA
jgi:carbon monoxide dehydrogenase subunit G